MTTIAIIPARAGSKRVPNKNLRRCAGRPLIAWTCDAAVNASLIDRTILSTDSESIASAGRRYGIEVPFLRPPELSGDQVPMIDVMLHLLNWLEQTGSTVNVVVLLQPTSPLRTAGHIDAALALLHSTGADSVVTATEMPDHYKENKQMTLRADGSVDFSAARPGHGNSIVIRNGPAILVTRPAVLRGGSLYGTRTLVSMMEADASIDIDTPDDFSLAEHYLLRRNAAGKFNGSTGS
ncbi:MAG: acylneuraminate cytidylyltransferase family protein [Ferrovibrio sp.]